MLSTLMPGFEINNRYHIRREKRGGMGVVYICFDKELQETVALKTFQKKYVLDKSMRDIFYAEANNWVDLGRHKNIVHAKRVEIIEFQPFIIIEYISGHDYYGPSLRDWITQQGLDLAIALSFAIQVCDAMIHIERVSKEKGNRLVHKDLKPDNIMITNDEIIKVTDFGLIGSTAQGGTPAYMSPEQWLGEDDIDIRSDIYSFGCVLYEMITGKWFFDIQGLDPKECFDHHINTLPSCIDGVSDTLNRLIQKCLAKKAGERYASFSQLKEQILHIYGGGVKRIEVDLKTDDDKEDWVQTAFNLTNLGRFSEALNLLTKYLSINPNNSIAWGNKGYNLEQVGKFKQAFECYQKSLELSPNNVKTLNNVAQVLLKRSKFEDALEVCEKAINLDPEYALIWNTKGQIFHYQGNYQSALEFYNRSLLINPKQINVLLNKARLFEDLGDYENLIICCEKALNINGGVAEIWDEKAFAEGVLERYFESLASSNQAIDLNPEFASPYNTKAYALEGLKRYQEAFENYDLAIKTNSSYALAHENKGRLYMFLNQYQKAIKSLDTALKIDSDRHTAILRKAICLREIGKKRAALGMFQEYVSVVPETKVDEIHYANVMIDELMSTY